MRLRFVVLGGIVEIDRVVGIVEDVLVVEDGVRELVLPEGLTEEVLYAVGYDWQFY
jgi:hypothetical protein